MKDLKKYEEMHAKIEALGDAGNYEGQAAAFIKGTGATVEAQYIDIKSGHFGPADDARDTWNIRITRNGRAYVFEYGGSIHDTEARIASQYPDGTPRSFREIRLAANKPSYNPLGFAIRFKKWETEAKEWGPAGINCRPSAYSVLCSVEKYEPEKDIDAFAAEFGIEKPSEAVRIHKAVLEGYAQMRALFDNDELETLSLIA